jgi:hypothetical protein
MHDLYYCYKSQHLYYLYYCLKKVPFSLFSVAYVNRFYDTDCVRDLAFLNNTCEHLDKLNNKFHG